MSGIHIASNESETYTPRKLLGGEAPIITESFVVAASITLAANSVFALNATGQLVEWDPSASDGTENAVAISCEAVDTTGGAAAQPMYTGGFFNSDQISWPTSTALEKLTAFVGTPIKHASLVTK